MTSLSINDIVLVKQIMLIGLSSAKFLLWDVNGVHFSYYHNVLAALSAGAKTSFLRNSCTPFFKFQIFKSEFRFRWTKN